MRRFLAIASLFLAFVLVGAGCAQIGGTKNSGETIKVGAILPLTGPTASFGQRLKGGLEIAAEEINSNGGVNDKKIEVIYEDGKNKNKESVSAFKKLTEVDNVDYIFVFGIGPTQATAPLAKDKDVVYIANTLTNIAKEGDNIFRDYWDAKNVGKKIGRAVEDSDVDRLGIIKLSLPYWEQLKTGFESEVGNDVEIKRVEYGFSTKDFRPHLTKLESFGTDGIFIAGYPGAQTESILKTINELGLADQNRVFNDHNFASRSVTGTISNVLEETNAVDIKYTPQGDRWKKIVDDYKSKYGQEPSAGDPAYTYDDLKILAKAIEKSGDNPQKVKNTLSNITYDGVVGKLNFDSNGNSDRGSYLIQYTNDGWKEYESKK